MAVWVMTEDTVEQDGMLHRPNCTRLDITAEPELHAAGTELRRRVAPKNCWDCEPEVEMRLGG
ncbi:MAG TPA: hypothetical protein VGH56_07100 [Solirubrobacteraceae bacterium]|jgi:hypothetical protein